MTWTEIERANKRGRPRRTTPAVRRLRAGWRDAKLILPPEMATGPRVIVHTDGNGKLGFLMGEKGERAVSVHQNQRHITIPAHYRDRIPYGTTDVTLERDGDMLVLDLNAIGAGQ